jgi:hypothetical protein
LMKVSSTYWIIGEKQCLTKIANWHGHDFILFWALLHEKGRLEVAS